MPSGLTVPVPLIYKRGDPRSQLYWMCLAHLRPHICLKAGNHNIASRGILNLKGRDTL